MTNLTNYHCHSTFCDGRADMEMFIRFAISNQFTSFGFSSHAPLPFPTNWTMEWDRMNDYIAEFNRLKEKYRDDIELILGLEIDYINNDYNPAISKFTKLPLDYRIGSVHLIPNKNEKLIDIDCSSVRFRDIVDNYFDSDIEYVVQLYYKQILKMIESGGFDILGHCDKIHYNASCYDSNLLNSKWYNTFMHEYLEKINRHGYQIEINTKSYYDLHTFYPDIRYFSFLNDIGAHVQVNSDSHYPDRINYGRIEALQALQAAGFKYVMEWHNDKWQEVSILL